MDEPRFDHFTRTLGLLLARRRAASLLAGAALSLSSRQPAGTQPTLGKRKCGKRRCNKPGAPPRKICFKKKCWLIPVAGSPCNSNGLPCRNGAICTATGLGGAEICVCPAGTSACGQFPETSCVNLRTDPFHCGSCLNRCLAGVTTCCAAGLLAPGECVDTQSDDRHCGGCGRPCGNNARCLGGQCVSTCRTGLTACGGACVDLTTSFAHCGSCNAACAAGTVCKSSTCVPGCLANGEECASSGQCCAPLTCQDSVCSDF